MISLVRSYVMGIRIAHLINSMILLHVVIVECCSRKLIDCMTIYFIPVLDNGNRWQTLTTTSQWWKRTNHVLSCYHVLSCVMQARCEVCVPRNEAVGRSVAIFAQIISKWILVPLTCIKYANAYSDHHHVTIWTPVVPPCPWETHEIPVGCPWDAHEIPMIRLYGNILDSTDSRAHRKVHGGGRDGS